MKLIFAATMCILSAAGADSDYGSNHDNCREVKQEKPVCSKHTRHVREKFTVTDYKEKCHFEHKTRHDFAHVKVSKDKCKTHVEEVKNRHKVYINNKVCEDAHDGYGGYGDKHSKPKCRIVREAKWVTDDDHVKKVSCHTEKDTKKIPVELHYKKEVCHEVPEKHHEYVTLEVKETKCHVEKYTRRVCDGNGGGGGGGHDDYYSGGGQSDSYGDNSGGRNSGRGDYGDYGDASRDSSHDDYGDDSYDSYGGSSGDNNGRSDYGDRGGNAYESGYGDESHDEDSRDSYYGGDRGSSSGYGGDRGSSSSHSRYYA